MLWIIDSVKIKIHIYYHKNAIPPYIMIMKAFNFIYVQMQLVKNFQPVK